jgi:H+/Cl- antiporter ClcA
MKFRKIIRRHLKRIKTYGFNLFVLSAITGVFTGIIVTFYNILAGIGEEWSVSIYQLLLQYPAFIPLLFLALAIGSILIGTLVKFVPMIRGSGIPQTEGAARGTFVFKWYVVLCSMFAASLACIYFGLAAGSEGPSIELGGCVGDATGSLLKRSQMKRRLQIAGGASAGFAVAFNAPITGMVFALEEAFRSFSAQVFISSAVSVICALLTRNVIRGALNLKVGYAFENFVFTQIDVLSYFYVAIAALIVALFAVAFYYLMLQCKKLFKKITFFKGTGKYIIPFTLSGAFGLITFYAMGGGHSFIDAIATGGNGGVTIASVFGLSVIASLIIIVILRFISMTMMMSCGVPCGVFIPMLAVGAGIGAILSIIFESWGFNGQYTDYLIIICMAVFFTTFVRAPITGICMVFELTGEFSNFLPALIGIVIGYGVSELFRMQPGYEKCLEMFIEEEGIKKNFKKMRVEVTIQHGSQADGGRVRKIIWPVNGLVVDVRRPDGSTLVPDGETILAADEVITFECETSSEEKLKDYLYEIVGKPIEKGLG